mmetsp:Transcript_42419/g.117037  ORF Transcript_42419/g.117037 Transcript_42419/m.117037 type:complete len:204 (+) Transcript_42419:694-1305(+)
MDLDALARERSRLKVGACWNVARGFFVALRKHVERDQQLDVYRRGFARAGDDESAAEQDAAYHATSGYSEDILDHARPGPHAAVAPWHTGGNRLPCHIHVCGRLCAYKHAGRAPTSAGEQVGHGPSICLRHAGKGALTFTRRRAVGACPSAVHPCWSGRVATGSGPTAPPRGHHRFRALRKHAGQPKTIPRRAGARSHVFGWH